MKHTNGDLPEWVSPIERESAFWRSGTEGVSLMLKVMGSTGLLVATIAARFRKGLLLTVWLRWRILPHPHVELASASSWLLHHMAHQVLLRGFIFMLLLAWDYYKCPPALSLASMCLRDGAFHRLLVLILWGQVYFLSSRLACLTPDGGAVTRDSFARNYLLCVVSLSLAFIISLLSVLNQAMRSVPEFLGIGGLSSMVLNSCVGGVQGVLTSAVLPRVCERLSGKRLSFLVTIGLFTNCILPAAAIAFLDTYCLGRWSSFWGPCRNTPKRFDRVVVVNHGSQTLVRVLSSSDICDAYQARTLTTLSTCMQLRLEGCKGDTHKGDREKLTESQEKVHSGCLQRALSGHFHGVFRVFFPYAFCRYPL